MKVGRRTADRRVVGVARWLKKQVEERVVKDVTGVNMQMRLRAEPLRLSVRPNRHNPVHSMLGSWLGYSKCMHYKHCQHLPGGGIAPPCRACYYY